MNRFDRLFTQMSGALLIIGPALLVAAAVVAAAGIGTTTGQWYDSPIEGVLMMLGSALQVAGFLAVARLIGATRPIFGLVISMFTLLGAIGHLIPSASRVINAGYLAGGISVAQLSAGMSGMGEAIGIFIVPFILCFFLNYLLMAVGLWMTKIAPRWSSVLLVLGIGLFIYAQATSEVIPMWAYIGAVTLWLVALLPVGLRLIRGEALADSAPVKNTAPA